MSEEKTPYIASLEDQGLRDVDLLAAIVDDLGIEEPLSLRQICQQFGGQDYSKEILLHHALVWISRNLERE